VYDTETGRFTSPDPFKGVLSDPASQNPYMYCRGNPVKYSDPSGYQPNTYEMLSTMDEGAGGASMGPEEAQGVIETGESVGEFAVPPVLATDERKDFGPIIPYGQARKLTKGHKHAIEAHELLEQRHLKAWGVDPELIEQNPSEINLRERHKRKTKVNRNDLEYGKVHSPEAVVEKLEGRLSKKQMKAVKDFLKKVF